MKICSLLPSGTEIVFALGLDEQLTGVSDLCDYPATAQLKPVVSRSLIDTTVLSSAEVEAKMRALQETGTSPFHIEAAMLHQHPPDLVLTQDTCNICDPTADDVQRALAGIQPPPRMLVLRPRTVPEIFASIMEVGEAAGVPARARALVERLQARLQAIGTRAAQARQQPRLLSLEGVDPLVAGGHWIPELKILAGGRDELFSPGCPAQRLTWTTIRDYDPDMLIITPCSSDLARSLREIGMLVEHPGWWELQAVRHRQVYVVDHVYYSRPGPRIVTGLEMLAQIVHPELFSGLIPPGTVLKLDLPAGQTCAPAALATHLRPYPAEA
ncbi:MAG: ABC transporter substrate-binding protein [Candidatus Tectimicrobiota bacterium]